MASSIKLFLILYFIAVAFIYALQRQSGTPVIIPGDIYIQNGARRIYIPLGSSFVLTLVLFLILNSIRKRLGVEF